MVVGVDEQGVVLENVGVVESKQYFLGLGSGGHRVHCVDDIHFSYSKQVFVGCASRGSQEPSIGGHHHNIARIVETVRVDSCMELAIVLVHQQPLAFLL